MVVVVGDVCLAWIWGMVMNNLVDWDAFDDSGCCVVPDHGCNVCDGGIACSTGYCEFGTSCCISTCYFGYYSCGVG